MDGMQFFGGCALRFINFFSVNNCIKILLSWNGDAINHVAYENFLFVRRVIQDALSKKEFKTQLSCIVGWTTIISLCKQGETESPSRRTLSLIVTQGGGLNTTIQPFSSQHGHRHQAQTLRSEVRLNQSFSLFTDPLYSLHSAVTDSNYKDWSHRIRRHKQDLWIWLTRCFAIWYSLNIKMVAINICILGGILLLFAMK